MSLPPNRTPFDNDLVTDPNAPRHTQPLPAQQPAPIQQPAPVPVATPAPPVSQAPTNAQSSTGSPPPPTFTPTAPPTLPSGPSAYSGVPSSGVPPLPRQVIPDDDDAPAQTTTLSARRVPMSVIAGLAAVGGAIGVVMLSGVFGRLAPRPDSTGVITVEQEQAREANQNATVQTTPAPSRVVVVPPRTSKPTAANRTDADSTDSNASRPDSANSDDASPNDVPTPDIAESNDAGPSDRGGRNVSSGSNRNFPASSRDTNDNSGSDTSNNDTPDDTADSGAPRNQDVRSGGSNNRDSNSGDNNNGDSSTARDVATSPRGAEDSDGGVKPRYVERKRSYSIRPPSGFQIAQRGRRTVWQGPGTAQFLVEVGDAEGASPREDWENLERGLRRKYGSRYKSHGIRETTINGRQAAIWEFELRTPKGRVRKMDVAVHDGKNGYAVLGSAPADDFENYRPVFERAVRSLQIDSNQTSDTDNSDRDQTDSSATAEGY